MFLNSFTLTFESTYNGCNLLQVSRVFHPNFSAKWRRYLYIFPFIDRKHSGQSSGKGEFHQSFTSNRILDSVNDKVEFESGNKSYLFSVSKVDRLLQKLEGQLLSYKMFARDTKASRNE